MTRHVWRGDWCDSVWVYQDKKALLECDVLMCVEEASTRQPDPSVSTRDGRFGSKVGLIGPQIGEIRDFFRSDFSTFGSSSQMY